ncbi:F0F1 ATP synthase subunit A [Mucilaginibacter achroorhodeus]|uniref:ATP synthase subunit a n=1 Tax=Mucilaginibacter achroorhodeus TaxID=2599294 RepID=A0A563TYJ9_9SPHI|nr:F0F1 ATP synthase subunit A [Mucilaginibacter achroorhodeus]TWR24447.1 F0F1 ATP synthase subunit A [Mucilaginibacter achroorhodeus]
MYLSHILNSKKIALSLILGVFLTFISCKTFAIQHEEHAVAAEETNTEKEFSPSEVILEHIADSHSWHLWGHTTVPLPVILYTDQGIEMFSSAHFEHGHADYPGKYYTYRLVKDKIAIVGPGEELTAGANMLNMHKKLIDLSITKNVVSMWISLVLLLIIFLSVSAAYKKRAGKAPKGLQSFMEPIILFVRDDIARPNIGYKYQRFMPLLLTVFFFIWINNLIGLVPFFPGGSNLTGNIAVTFVLSVITLIIVNVNGNKYYWKHIFAPDVPVWLYPIMWPVELVGIISKPFALMIRLFANITAGHIIVLSLISLIFVFKSVAIAPVSVAFVVFMDVLELLVAALQAFIFTLLTALFIGTAIEEHHH